MGESILHCKSVEPRGWYAADIIYIEWWRGRYVAVKRYIFSGISVLQAVMSDLDVMLPWVNCSSAEQHIAVCRHPSALARMLQKMQTLSKCKMLRLGRAKCWTHRWWKKNPPQLERNNFDLEKKINSLHHDATSSLTNSLDLHNLSVLLIVPCLPPNNLAT